MSHSDPVKVMHITSVHSADDVRIRLKECQTLTKAGINVVLAAPHVGRSIDDQVLVETIQPSKTRLWRAVSASFQLALAVRKHRPLVVHFHDPELLPLGFLLQALGYKVVYDVHEDVPRQILKKKYLKEWVKLPISRAIEFLESLAARFFSGVIVATPHIQDRFSNYDPVLVQNFPLLGELTIEAQPPYAERAPAFAYLGGITLIRGLAEMVEAAEIVNQEVPALLSVAGAFSPAKLKAEAHLMPGWDRVDYKGVVDRRGAAEMLSGSRAGLVLFHPLPNHVNAQPNKLFEYMAASIPVIASDFPLWRDIIEQVDCGIIVNPLDPVAIAAAMRLVLLEPAKAEEMGKRGACAVQNKYNWSAEAPKLLQLYASLTQTELRQK